MYAEPNNFDDIKKLSKENKCIAVMIEIVQGEGGVCPLDKEYVQQIKRIYRKERHAYDSR